MEEDRYTRITLRIPRELHSRLYEEADETSKSLNAEIISRLEASFSPAAQPDAEWRLEVEIRANEVRMDTAKFHLTTLQMHGAMLRQQLESLERTGASAEALEAARSKVEKSAFEEKDLQKRIKEFLNESFRLDSALSVASKPRRERLAADADKALQPDYRAIGKSEDAMGLPDELRQIKTIPRAAPIEAPPPPPESAADRLRASLKPNKKGR